MWTPLTIQKYGMFRLLTFLNDEAKIYPHKAFCTVYDKVLDGVDQSDFYQIRVNGILTETMSEDFYISWSNCENKIVDLAH